MWVCGGGGGGTGGVVHPCNNLAAAAEIPATAPGSVQPTKQSHSSAQHDEKCNPRHDHRRDDGHARRRRRRDAARTLGQGTCREHTVSFSARNSRKRRNVLHDRPLATSVTLIS